MQATTRHNLKKSKGPEPERELLSFGTTKGDLFQVIISLNLIQIAIINTLHFHRNVTMEESLVSSLTALVAF